MMKARDFVQMDLLGWMDAEPSETVTELSFNEQARQDIADRDGVSRQCKHLSIWNKRECNNCFDCIDAGSEEAIARRRHPDTGTDGITRDRFEDFIIPLSGKVKAKIEINLACGDSGNWYYGCSLHYNQAGTAHAPLAKFSDKYATRYSAYWFAMKYVLEYFKKQKAKPEELKTIKKALLDTGNTISSSEQHRHEVCDQWRECGYAEKCFEVENDAGENPVCFKDQLTEQSKEAAEGSLLELCKACHKTSFCAGCCSTCSSKCNSEQACSWPK